MSAQRFIGLSALLCVVGSCATRSAPNTQAIAPKVGPKASIYVTYTGGMLNRTADATFKVDPGTYAMVAHLGGDGQIEVLYPTDARETGKVPGGKYFRTRTFSAYYDAVPQLYSFAMTQFRNLGAQLDSYDGIGHGYVFIIASRYPLRFDRISDFGLWDDFEAENYRTNPDPRTSVKKFADIVASGHEYTLKFARSMGNLNASSSIDQMFDCAYFSSFGLGAFGGYSWTFASLAYQALNFGTMAYSRFAGGYPGCGGSRYASYGYFPTRTYVYVPSPNQGTPQNPAGPARGPHFGRRIGTTPGQDVNRPTYTPRTGTNTESSALPDFGPRGRTHSFGTRATDIAGTPPPTREPVYEAPRSPRWSGSSDASPAYTPRETRVEHSAPATHVERPQAEAPRAQPAQPAPRAQPAREAPPPSPRDERKPRQ